MTVMPSSAEVADKAVSTEDAVSGVEVARLEAVLAALVETKVEAMKASSTSTRRSGSAPSTPRRTRLTSSSTGSSSQNHYHHHHHHHHEHNRHDKRKRERHYHRRHDSAPCGEYIEDLTIQDHHRARNDKGRRRGSELPRSPRKRRRPSRSPHLDQSVQDRLAGHDMGLDLLGIDGDQELALINFERAREAFNDSTEFRRLQRSSCCFSQSAAQLKIHYDGDDYLALNLEDELEEEESLSGPDKKGGTSDRYHRPRRKRKRRRQKIGPEEPEADIGDPEELPPRARWTIVATACLLLAMSLLLVGVTLRMAPIIDDMGDGRRASVCKRGRPRRASTVRRKDVVCLTKTVAKEETKVTKDPLLVAQQKRHRRIAMIVLGAFVFLLIASIMVVVVTLTHSSFHSSASDSKDHADSGNDEIRKENEELYNSLNQNSSTTPANATVPP